jgi:2-oxoglutarate dehydrogenase E1 component
MYEQYRKDPKSVDAAWLDFFKTYRDAEAPTNGRAVAKAPADATSATPTPVAKPSVAPTPSAATDPARTTSPRPAATTPATKPVPKEPSPPRSAEASDESTYTVLRGAPARTVQNMDASLTVPTATSVRQVPVKLLWDNRIVINNHLARARGGKVSFTHLIGFALVKALKSMPEMNVGYDVVDGKPNLVTPAHINLGLAIDLPRPDGTRQLLVPSIKATESMSFAHFW